jgi:hypothetical protein
MSPPSLPFLVLSEDLWERPRRDEEPEPPITWLVLDAPERAPTPPEQDEAAAA